MAEDIPFDTNIAANVKTKLDNFSKEAERAEILLLFDENKRMRPIYEKRKQVIKTIPNFWPIAILRHSFLRSMFDDDDMDALGHLVDVDVKRLPQEPRVFTLEFTFNKNPYFNDTVLRKEYKYVESLERRNERADSEGFKWSMLDFDWETDVKPQVTQINWKQGKNLSRQRPVEKDDDDEIADLGSFFNFFTSSSDPFEIGPMIAEEIFPDAIDYFTGEINDLDFDEDEDEEEEEVPGEDDEEEEQVDDEDDEEEEEDEEEDEEEEEEDYGRHYSSSKRR